MPRIVSWSPALLAAAALTAMPAAALTAMPAAALTAMPAAAQKKDGDAPQLSVGRTPMTAPAQDAVPPPPPAPTTTIAQALPTLPGHATLVRLVRNAQLEATLAGPGPFTVFAPGDDAFTRLAPGTLDTLLKPENVATLTTILKYHVLAGIVTVDQIKAQITAGGGRAVLATVAGQPLTASLENGALLLTDANGGKSYIGQADIPEANGVVHVTNGVSIPKLQ